MFTSDICLVLQDSDDICSDDDNSDDDIDDTLVGVCILPPPVISITISIVRLLKVCLVALYECLPCLHGNHMVY